MKNLVWNVFVICTEHVMKPKKLKKKMIFSLFFSLSFSVLDRCVGSRTFPDLPNSSYKPVHAQIFLRHGARSPIIEYSTIPTDHRGIWQCDGTSASAVAAKIEGTGMDRPRRIRRILDNRLATYPPNCATGDLTIEGMKMHENLGLNFRDYIVNKLQLLPDYLDPNLITARATWYERTYRSCISFLRGLYPVQGPNEILDIIVGTQNLDVVHPTKDMCPDLAELREEFFNSEFYQNFSSQVKETIQPLYEFVGTNDTSPEGIEKMCDFFITYNCNEQKIGGDELFTDEMLEQCNLLQAYHFYKLNFFSKEKGALGAAPILREMFRELDMSLNGYSNAKLNIISAHDSVIAFVLSALGYGNDEIAGPPYSSYLTMEIYLHEGDYYVRFAYNGMLVPLFGTDQTMIKLHDLRQKLMPTMNHCTTVP